MAEVRLSLPEGLAEGTVCPVDAGGRRVALARIGGVVYAFDDRCPHAGGPLGEGKVEEGAIRCPWHERRFDPRAGVCLTHPATRPATCYPVREEAGQLWLELPE